jgi:hypothetical protein
VGDHDLAHVEVPEAARPVHDVSLHEADVTTLDASGELEEAGLSPHVDVPEERREDAFAQSAFVHGVPVTAASTTGVTSNQTNPTWRQVLNCKERARVILWLAAPVRARRRRLPEGSMP